MLTVKKTPLQGCIILKPDEFKDSRGTFCETFNERDFKKTMGFEVDFVQDNQSISRYGVLRGLHFQRGTMAQAKLVRVIKGRVLDIVVDLRKESKTFGDHFSLILDDVANEQLFVPRGFAHGFITLSESSIFSYKCDNFYDRSSEGGIKYNDATLMIDWHLPKEDLIISEKDLSLPSFKEVLMENGYNDI